MLNDTLLTRSVSEENRWEFLFATASQLDKLEFLIQAMVKTSRLETGIITMKKNRPITDALAMALNGASIVVENSQTVILSSY